MIIGAAVLKSLVHAVVNKREHQPPRCKSAHYENRQTLKSVFNLFFSMLTI
jgi:hypothetical protein